MPIPDQHLQQHLGYPAMSGSARSPLYLLRTGTLVHVVKDDGSHVQTAMGHVRDDKEPVEISARWDGAEHTNIQYDDVTFAPLTWHFPPECSALPGDG